MARTIREAKLETRAARQRLAPQPKPHWKCLVPGQLHLGYRRRRKDAPGSWSVRRYSGLDAAGKGRYEERTLGLADDYQDADGEAVLSFAEAQRLAHEAVAAKAAVEAAAAVVTPPTVQEVVDEYLQYMRDHRKSAGDAESRARTHILPALGAVRVDQLTTHQLNKWLDELAAVPARARTRPGQAQRYRAPADTDDAKRGRRATANRTLTVLKAALNRAFERGWVHDDKAWRRLKPFRYVGAARPGHLSVDEAVRVIAGAEGAFKALVEAALHTGCRYGELCALKVEHFARGKVVVGKSKSGKPRDVRLSEQGRAFFAAHCADRPGDEVMFRRADGEPWGPSHQARPMLRACEAAGVAPVGFHQLRHTWASLAVMGGMPLMIVSKNMGHADTRMVELHYGHLTDSFMDKAVEAGAPRFEARPSAGA